MRREPLPGDIEETVHETVLGDFLHVINVFHENQWLRVHHCHLRPNTPDGEPECKKAGKKAIDLVKEGVARLKAEAQEGAEWEHS